MSTINGSFYFDLRSVAGPEIDNFQGCSHRAPGVEMRQMPSVFEGQQGLVASNDGSACAWDGRLDNWGEIPGHFSTSKGQIAPAPADVAFRLYREKGTDGLRDLIGDWSLAIWDAGHRSLVLASDYAGIRPLYYYRGADRVLWSSSLTEIVNRSGIREIDDEYVARLLTVSNAGCLTPYRGIRAVPPGKAVIISREGIEVSAFWTPPVDQGIRFESDRGYIEGLQHLFREAVRVRMRGHATVCAELSGGMDSSSVVCMAHQIATAAGGPKLATFSYTHPNCADEPYFLEVERACGIEGVHLDLEKFPLVAAGRAGQVAPGWWAPRMQELTRQMEALGSGVLLTGQVGDFITGNMVDDSEQVADLLQQGKWLKAAREAYTWSRYLEMPVYSILLRSVRARYSSWIAPVDAVWTGPPSEFAKSDSLTPRLREMAACVAQSEKNLWAGATPTRRRRLHCLSAILNGRVLQVPEGLERFSYTHPFAHRPLVEFMLSVPAEQICRPYEPRRLMRRAFDGLLPRAILKRPWKASYAQVYRQALLPLAAAMLARSDRALVAELGYVDAESLRERLRRFTQGLECNEMQLRQVILLEHWLQAGHGEGRELEHCSTATFAGPSARPASPSPVHC